MSINVYCMYYKQLVYDGGLEQANVSRVLNDKAECQKQA